ncbi:MAG: LacI family transcriptional regulator [Reichenbachiella sp.]
MKKKVTIHDLARELEINSSTVSRALANSPRVKQKTRDRVQAKAREMGYFPNTLASNLRSKRTNTIGVIVPHISRFFLSSVIAGIEEVAFENNYRVFICQSQDSLEREQQLTQTLLSNQVDGVIMSISMETDRYDHLQSIKDQDVPIVFFDRKCNEIDASNIAIDDYTSAFQATSHLIQYGCKNIAHFTGNEKISIYQDRLRGYRHALTNHSLPIDESLIYRSGLKPNDGKKMAEEMLKREILPDGLFSANDLAAISAMQVLQQRNINIPKDIAIIGFSNEPLGAYTNPPLSSVDQKPHEMGQQAAKTLIDQIQNQSKKHNDQTIKASLIIRDSSKRSINMN